MRTQEKKLRALIAEQAAEWHVAQSEGALSPQRAQDFMCWLRTSPAHVAEYLTLVMLAKDLSEAARESDASLRDVLLTDEDIRPLRKEATAGSSRRELTFSPRSFRERSHRSTRFAHTTGRSRTRWAAAIAGLIVTFVLALVSWQWPASGSTIETFATRHGQIRTLQLPDRTTLQLDSDSAVTVRFDRHNRRVVVDRGQAYFKVIKDAGRPFSVQVGRSQIRDIGTAFDVYRHASGATIMVAEGHVQVWHVPQRLMNGARWFAWLKSAQKLPGQPIADLGAGEQVHVTNTGLVTSLGNANVSQTLAWRSGHVAFDNADIATVAAEFNRYNEQQILVVDPRTAALKITGTFDSHDVQSFVAFLRNLPGVVIEQHGQGIVVRARDQQTHHHD